MHSSIYHYMGARLSNNGAARPVYVPLYINDPEAVLDAHLG
jgi:hypothetical protein